MKLTSSFLRPACVAALTLVALDSSAQPTSAAASARVAPGASAAPAPTVRAAPAPSAASAAAIDTVPGMAPVTDRANLYGDAGAGKLSEVARDALPRVYVPNLQSNDVYVIDPATFTVVGRFKVGLNPQHVVPSWDLKTLWVANNAENTTKGSLTPIDPKTGKPGKAIAVDDPYNMYFTPDGSTFYVADMMADGVFVVDGASFKEIGFVKTGKGTHGLYPSRDGKKLYVTNRGSNKIHGAEKGKGSVSVLDFATRTVDVTWPIPGGGSPDMGNVSADGKWLWLSGRYDNVVYAIDTTSGEVKIIKVGREPHGLTVWPQPGRYSLGHTGNMR